MRVRTRTLLTLALVGTAIAVPALAQQGAPYPEPCTAAQVKPKDHDNAHSKYLDGKKYLDESNYDIAIALFRESYKLDCSVHDLLKIIATAYERKGDKAEAVRALRLYVARAPNADDRETVELRIRNLESSMGTTAPPSSTPPPSATPPSSSATAPASTTAPTSSATTAPSSSASSGTPENGGAHSTLPWVIVGVGAGLAVVGGVVFGIGESDLSAASGCGSQHNACKDQATADKGNTGRVLVPIGAVVGGIGLAGVVVGLVMHFNEKPQSQEPTPAPSARVTPTLGPGYAGVSVGGTF